MASLRVPRLIWYFENYFKTFFCLSDAYIIFIISKCGLIIFTMALKLV